MTREPTTEAHSEAYCGAWRNGFESRDAEIGELRAENERLRAALKGALSMVEAFASGPGFSHAGRIEYENYRAALEPKP